LVDVNPGVVNTFKIGEVNISIKIPRENQGTKGIMIADPCFSSEFVHCEYKDTFDTFNRLTSLLNAAAKHDDLDFWGILGDNFYDKYGDHTKSFFDQLSLEAKSKVFLSVIGNHDYWINGDPLAFSLNDQHGNGFMQFYAQDTFATLQSESEVFDFRVDPDSKWIWQSSSAHSSNFAFYNKIGNMGFLGYSGAYSYEENLPYLQ